MGPYPSHKVTHWRPPVGRKLERRQPVALLMPLATVRLGVARKLLQSKHTEANGVMLTGRVSGCLMTKMTYQLGRWNFVAEFQAPGTAVH